MRRFGFKSAILFLLILQFIIYSCCNKEKKYHDDDIAPLATLSRVVMDIVKSDYIGKPVPSEIDENEIRKIITSRKKRLETLNMLDKYDIKIFSNNSKLAAVIWDPGNGRKLIEDLRCTKKVDFKAWKEVLYNQELTLNWDLCR